MKEEQIVDLECQKTLLAAINRSLRNQNQKLIQLHVESKSKQQSLTANKGLVMLTMTLAPLAFFCYIWPGFGF